MEPSSFATRLADALIRVTPQHPEAVDDLRPLYADDMTFRDPIQIVHGLDAFLAMNRRLIGRMRSIEWTIHTSGSDAANTVFLEWTMRGKTKLGPTLRLDGVTRATLRDGRIIDHRDYWDLAELLTSPFAAGQNILRALLRPLA